MHITHSIVALRMLVMQLDVGSWTLITCLDVQQCPLDGVWVKNLGNFKQKTYAKNMAKRVKILWSPAIKKTLN